jgi:hypothetical protein
MQRLAGLPPVDRLAECRRLEPRGQPGAWVPERWRPATAEELERLEGLPPIERLAEARRLGIA